MQTLFRNFTDALVFGILSFFIIFFITIATNSKNTSKNIISFFASTMTLSLLLTLFCPTTTTFFFIFLYITITGILWLINSMLPLNRDIIYHQRNILFFSTIIILSLTTIMLTTTNGTSTINTCNMFEIILLISPILVLVFSFILLCSYKQTKINSS